MNREIEEYLASRVNGTYERDNFERYIAKRKLSLSTPTIHVTGSNGKGSTCRYLEAIYLSAGYEVASFIKPRFYAVNECIRVNGKDISDEDLRNIFDENKKDFDKFDLTEFEVIVALAYRYFEKVKPDIAIVECGMGGAIDATNIENMNTVLGVITTISLEHTAYLGSTLSQIALHKAGIIKPNSLALIGRIDEECETVIREEAKSVETMVYRADAHHFEEKVGVGYRFAYGSLKELVINTPAEYQINNACLAIEATHVLGKIFPVSEEAIRKGIAEAPLPGRMEIFGRIIVDGAHNPEATNRLCSTLPSVIGDKPLCCLFASFRDKNIAVMLPQLALLANPIYLTTFDHVRARGESDYFLYAGDHPYKGDAVMALRELLDEYPEDYVLVTGSLAFAGFMRKVIIEKGWGFDGEKPDIDA